MISQILNQINSRALLTAAAAKDIAAHPHAYRLLDDYSTFIYNAALEGKSSVKIEVLRHYEYDECKKLQFDPDFAFVVNECKAKGYQAYFTSHIDDKTQEYYVELELIWGSV